MESVAQITEMTKLNHSAATARVKLADKMVMLPLLLDGTKPEVVKQHYERFNCKVVLPVSLVVHNALRSVGDHCEMACKFFVRVLRSTGVLHISHTNVKVALGSRSPFILVLVAVTVLCYKLHLNKCDVSYKVS